MTGKERVYKTIRHEPTDRPPLGFDATPEMQARIMAHLGAADKYAMYDMLGVDLYKPIVSLSDRAVGDWFGTPFVRKTPRGYLDVWGIEFVIQPYADGEGVYTEMVTQPLADATLEQIAAYPLPDLAYWDFSAFAEELKRPQYRGKYVLTNMIGLFDQSRFLRGLENFFIDLIEDPPVVDALLDKVCDFLTAFFDAMLPYTAGLLDGVMICDDFGSQSGMMIHPDSWRRYVKPRYKRLIQTIKKHGVHYFQHCCGGILPIIPDLIEIGVDVLNPLQPRVKGMDSESLNRLFGKDLTFYGGIDEQCVLSGDSIEDVRSEVRLRLRTLGKDGGYIAAPTGHFQLSTSPGNAVAVYETVLGCSL